ncbi:MAG: hypothetical protein HKN25_13380 [Pyrinomonadaceae bacterium]|nr:hypothetical protein [Pyrinomonadaceae bacterium]
MEKINLNGREFCLETNSKNGEVSYETVFRYSQDGELVTAEYGGGSIRHGRIVGRQTDEGNLDMVYHCMTTAGELKAGKAEAMVSLDRGRVRLDLRWEWLSGDRSSGTSSYVEIDD